MFKIKNFSSLIICFLTLSLTSCFDITQSITLQDNKYSITVRCGFDKNLMYLAQVDQDFFTEDFDKLEANCSNLGGTFNIIDTADEYGMFFHFDCSTDEELTDDLSLFVPEYRNGKIYIPFVMGQEISETDTNDSLDMAATMISIAKFKLLLSKSVKQQISSAQLITASGKHTLDLEVSDFNDMFCISVPIKTIFLSRYTYEYIVIK